MLKTFVVGILSLFDYDLKLGNYIDVYTKTKI